MSFRCIALKRIFLLTLPLSEKYPGSFFAGATHHESLFAYHRDSYLWLSRSERPYGESHAGALRRLPCESRPSTINIILLLDAKLTRSSMLNAIITATEAKSAVMNEMDIRTPDGVLATGTSTDKVTVAMTGFGPIQPYAGPATVLGWLIAKTVRQALRESLLAM